ncbi:hypothetical protein [Paenibacillus glacialis]|nr:hypothetical protein [Paenibacillus glacialis]
MSIKVLIAVYKITKDWKWIGDYPDPFPVFSLLAASEISHHELEE